MKYVENYFGVIPGESYPHGCGGFRVHECFILVLFLYSWCIIVLCKSAREHFLLDFYLSGSIVFPVDFFEHCSVMNDIEFGGNDLLQVYNVQQLKNRLNSQGS